MSAPSHRAQVFSKASKAYGRYYSLASGKANLLSLQYPDVDDDIQSRGNRRPSIPSVQTITVSWHGC